MRDRCTSRGLVVIRVSQEECHLSKGVQLRSTWLKKWGSAMVSPLCVTGASQLDKHAILLKAKTENDRLSFSAM
ncbi:unnamed protein product, partial [Nesidiocoris tenuis]